MPRVRLAHQFSLARLEVLLVRLRRRPAGPVSLMRGGGANAAAPGAPAQGQSWYQGQQGAVGGRSMIPGAAGGPGQPAFGPSARRCGGGWYRCPWHDAKVDDGTGRRKSCR